MMMMIGYCVCVFFARVSVCLRTGSAVMDSQSVHSFIHSQFIQF